MSEPEAPPAADSGTPPGAAAASPHSALPPQTINPEGHDAICFTAGPKAAVVGAGVIHAYLAAGRQAPRAVAGISIGSLNAAAMQRVYRDLAAARGAPPAVEQAARWAWFRRYIDAFSASTFDVLWKAIPDQSDFFADMIPIRDTSTPPMFQQAEQEARRDLYLKVKLGRWLAHLPVSVRLLASAGVHYVRMRERYPWLSRAASAAALLINATWFAVLVMFRVCISPQFFPEHRFREARGVEGTERRRRWPHPRGIGWLNLASITIAVLLFAPLLLLMLFEGVAGDGEQLTWRGLYLPLVAFGAVAVLITLTAPFRERMLQWRFVRAVALPLIGGAAYLYSLINAAAVVTLVGLGAWALYCRFAGTSPGSIATSALMVWLVWCISSLLVAPVLALREVRHWLVRIGLLELWPRPLFGWGVYLVLWLGLLASLLYVAFGAYFAWSVLRLDWQRGAAFAAGAPLALLAILSLPLLPLALSAPLWRAWRPVTQARLGWRRHAATALSAFVSVVLLGLVLQVFLYLTESFRGVLANHGVALDSWWLFTGLALTVMLIWFTFASVLAEPVKRRWFVERLLDQVGLKQALVPDYHLRRLLQQLFDPEAARRPAEEGDALVVDEGPGYPAAVLVAAPLQTLAREGRPQVVEQLWARPGTPLLHALRCAMSVPPLFAPVRIEPRELKWWVKDSALADPANEVQFARGIDVVDGSVIRQNPLPALFGALRGMPAASEMAAHNDATRPAIHVVYGVPTTPGVPPPAGRTGDPSAEGAADSRPSGNTIVDVGLNSLRLSQRRDTQLEVLQTNLIARTEQFTPSEGTTKRTYPLFADEIAPEQDVVFSNNLSPTRDEILGGIAGGCRRTLERLYGHAMTGSAAVASDGSIGCGDLLRIAGRALEVESPPGLPEVCGTCTGRLRAPVRAIGLADTPSIRRSLGSPEALVALHPQLSGERPRIVFVASGGVFRGAFHIGILAALRVTDAKPDLIVGASVGTLMGGALGAMFCQPQGRTLDRLVDAFLRVDECVALTPTLKGAAREIGIRGRSVPLSPRDIRRMVRRGARRDPGFAATGAPSALIDAMADLFLIPHRATQEIAAEFVAGKVAGAVKKLLTELRTETIRRLDVERAVLGTSLLEQVAVELLSHDLGAGRAGRQPFQQAGIAFYATTTNLSTQSAVLLGSQGLHAGAPYDFVEAALASSAFPVAFAPRPESLVFPGTGRSDVLFADGGMFDNLPFVPAIQILSRAQRGWRQQGDASRTAFDLIARRSERPDLIIVGALDPRPEAEDTRLQVYDSIEAVRRRAVALQHNVKIRSFEQAAHRVDRQLLRLHARPPAWTALREPHAVDGVVNAGVLASYPASRDHLNGTFAFCASMGLSRPRVQRSIADGCYQTLLGMARRQQEADATTEAPAAARPLTVRAVAGLTHDGRMARLEESWDPTTASGRCPFFRKNGARFDCPFSPTGDTDPRHAPGIRGVYQQCRADSWHRPG